MSLEVLTGLPGAGKSTTLIRKVNAAIEAGRPYATFACSDSPILTSRASVQFGRLASRTPQLSMPLTHLVSLPEAVEALSTLEPNAVAGFDEAQYFGEGIVPYWLDAASRGVEVIVATPSAAQLAELERRGVAPTELQLACEICQHATADRSFRLPKRDGTLALCDRCAEPLLASVRAELVDRLRRHGPHPGEKSLYQPVELPEFKSWKAIRNDSERRADILAGVAAEAMAGRDPAGPLPTYLDVGCNTGYLCHLMRRRGFSPTGVDTVEDDLVIARLLECYFRRDGATFVRADAYDYLRQTPDERFDVSSAFSVFQWVMIQRSPEHGIDCIKWLFEKTRSVCVLEMGDSSEAHYRDRIGIDIGTDWTREMMEQHGGFDDIRIFEAGRHKLKRDLVVGLRFQRPSAADAAPPERERVVVSTPAANGNGAGPAAEAAQPAGAGEVLGRSDEQLPYRAPAELLGEWRETAPPVSWEVVSEWAARGVHTSEIRFPTETHAGETVFMHGYLCRPQKAAPPLPPTLLIPGGGGKLGPEYVAWQALQTGSAVLGVDWIGVGGSSSVGLDPPSKHALRFRDHDVRSSYQYHNLRAFVQATEVLLSQDDIVPAALGVMGSSWGGFYSLALGGLDSRFAHVRPTYGCGFFELGCHQIWGGHLAEMDPEDIELWRQTFDPGRRAHLIAGDVMYIQATNDRYFGLTGTMRTYDRIGSPKRLLLVHNQDHTVRPYDSLGVHVFAEQLRGGLEAAIPVVEASWLPGEAAVEVTVDGDRDDVRSAGVVYSAGSYTSWAARRWHRAEATRDGDRWVAEIPVVNPGREIWFYGQVELSAERAASSVVRTIRPADAGVTHGTASHSTSFSFGEEPEWSLPIGDPGSPPSSLVTDGGVSALSISFVEDNPYLRSAVYCLEGDLIAAEGYDQVEVMLRVPDPADADGLYVALFTDYATIDEQAYGIEASRLLGGSTDWQQVTLRFDELEWRPHRVYYGYTPPARPLDPERICAVGLLRSGLDYVGGGLIGDVRVSRSAQEPARAEEPEASPYELRIETTQSPDELRAQLRRWEPWRMEVVFSNGVRTSELAQGKMFTPRPLEKWRHFESEIPADALRGARALDVGSNVGHYAIHLRREYGMEVTGLEPNRRTREAAQFLVATAGLDGIRFLDGDANTWQEGSGYRLVLNLGTLDHLEDPAGALRNAAAMLEPDGYLALELQTLVDEDPFRSRYAGDDPSTTCTWFLGRGALLRMLEEAGFDRTEILFEWRRPDLIGEDMERLVLLARKPAES